jgi:hypothetical protein
LEHLQIHAETDGIDIATAYPSHHWKIISMARVEKHGSRFNCRLDGWDKEWYPPCHTQLQKSRDIWLRIKEI